MACDEAEAWSEFIQTDLTEMSPNFDGPFRAAAGMTAGAKETRGVLVRCEHRRSPLCFEQLGCMSGGKGRSSTSFPAKITLARLALESPG